MADTPKRPLTVEEARAKVLAGVVPLAGVDEVDLLDAQDRILAVHLIAQHSQPPFAASAMDGYAVRANDITTLPVTLRQVGEAAAGHAFQGTLSAGEAVRIFTGAPMPRGADAVVIQENTSSEGHRVTIAAGTVDFEHVRPQGGDFSAGSAILAAGQRLRARHLTLAAAAGYSCLTVRRKPVVAILATGDELVQPGATRRTDQIVCSNPFGVAAMVTAAGGTPRLLGIAKDTTQSLDAKIDQAAEADILVTLGGASVGDHDLVGPVLVRRGMALAFWKIAMRPGKPMMFGMLGSQRVLGLPGNPVSSLITARLFLVPLVRALLGYAVEEERRERALLSRALPANGPRAHYMRASRSRSSSGADTVTPVANQDSSLLMPLAAADCLIVRPIGAVALAAGVEVDVMPLDF